MTFLTLPLWISGLAFLVTSPGDLQSADNPLLHDHGEPEFTAQALWYRSDELDDLHVDNAIHKARVEQAFIGEERAVVVAYQGCLQDVQGQCEVEVMFEVQQPNGKTYRSPRMNAWPGDDERRVRAADDTYITARYLSPAHLVISFEDGDPVGSYRLIASVYDLRQGRRAVSHQHLWVLPKP